MMADHAVLLVHVAMEPVHKEGNQFLMSQFTGIKRIYFDIEFIDHIKMMLAVVIKVGEAQALNDVLLAQEVVSGKEHQFTENPGQCVGGSAVLSGVDVLIEQPQE